MKYALALLALALFASNTAHAQEVAWNLDKSHTHIGFIAKHLAFAKVRGNFREFDATIRADLNSGKVTSVVATAKAASIDTDNKKRDDHLRSDDFFAASQFPLLKIESTGITWQDAHNFEATAELTIRNVTKPVLFKGEFAGVQKVSFGGPPHHRAAYSLTTTISRSAFGLRFNGVAEGVAIVSDSVVIELEVELSTPLPAP